MLTVQIGEFKTRMSYYLTLLQKGQEIGLFYGKAKKPVAKLIPWVKKTKKRKLGLLSKYGRVLLKDFEIKDEELLEA